MSDHRETREPGPTPEPAEVPDANPAGPVREEDALDAEAVVAWLREHADEPGRVPQGTPEVRQYAGGASNLTYLLRWPGAGGPTTGDARDAELILRRPPHGSKAAGAHDMGREHTVQSRLAPVFGYVPTMVAACDDESVLGAPFYVMTKVDGIVLRAEPPVGMTLTPDRTSALAERFLDVLVELHRVDAEAAGLTDIGKGAGYVERQVTGWSKRYRAARTDNVGDYEAVMAWLAERMPGDVATCVIHNDFRLDNVVLAEGGAGGAGGGGGGLAAGGAGAGNLEIRAVLDWEMATLGDPLMDLGGALAYWIQADDDGFYQGFKRQPSDLPGMPTRWGLVEGYAARTGRTVTPGQWTFYEVFGLFRLAVIAQQIYYRYHHGQTTNEAYAGFLPVVQYLEQRCTRLIAEAGR